MVIGAGLQGICTAYYLAEAGVAVTVLERNDGPALEASFGNGGYIQAECPEIWNQPGILGVPPLSDNDTASRVVTLSVVPESVAEDTPEDVTVTASLDAGARAEDTAVRRATRRCRARTTRGCRSAR